MGTVFPARNKFEQVETPLPCQQDIKVVTCTLGGYSTAVVCVTPDARRDVNKRERMQQLFSVF